MGRKSDERRLVEIGCSWWLGFSFGVLGVDLCIINLLCHQHKTQIWVVLEEGEKVLNGWWRHGNGSQITMFGGWQRHDNGFLQPLNKWAYLDPWWFYRQMEEGDNGRFGLGLLLTIARWRTLPRVGCWSG